MALSLVITAIVLIVLTAVHLYLYRRLVRDVTRAGGGWRRLSGVLIGLLAVLTVVLLLGLGPMEPPFPIRRVATWTAGVWLPLLGYLVVALLLGSLIRRRSPAADPARRLFVARTVAVGATVLAAGATAATRAARPAPPEPEAGGVEVALPFTGLWLARNSPASQVPSHGTDQLGGRYAIDFVAVDEQHRTSAGRNWRSVVATEEPDVFYAFGRPILAPVDGTIVAAHDGEPDHEARRAQPALVPYMLTQGDRLRQGVNAIAGNHVIIALPGGTFVALVHFRAGTLRVATGQRVVVGQHLADCGNSGNSTQPHVHIQAMDSDDLSVARGVPLRFKRFREWTDGPGEGRIRDLGVPPEEAVVQAL